MRTCADLLVFDDTVHWRILFRSEPGRLSQSLAPPPPAAIGLTSPWCVLT